MVHQKLLQFSLAVVLGCAGGVGNANMNSAAPEALAPQALAKKMAAVRVPFIKNQGQIANDDVQFYAQMFAGTLFVTKGNHLVYSLPQKDKKIPGQIGCFVNRLLVDKKHSPKERVKVLFG
jgi:hypothetical protein